VPIPLLRVYVVGFLYSICLFLVPEYFSSQRDGQSVPKVEWMQGENLYDDGNSYAD